MDFQNDNKMDLIAISLIRKILKSRICEKIIANCEEWYRKVGSRICEIANCEDLELRGIPVCGLIVQKSESLFPIAGSETI